MGGGVWLLLVETQKGKFKMSGKLVIYMHNINLNSSLKIVKLCESYVNIHYP
jgi:hypothetical protein